VLSIDTLDGGHVHVMPGGRASDSTDFYPDREADWPSTVTHILDHVTFPEDDAYWREQLRGALLSLPRRANNAKE